MKDYLHDLSRVDELLTHYVFPFAWHLCGAIAVWVAGNLVIRTIQRFLRNALERRSVDRTLMNYAHATIGLVLRVVLILFVLGIFGIETTSFSAILAAAGVAIGVAFSGLLSNFAAGVFLIIFRPFGLGDNVSAGGVTGTVREIGIFATLFDSGDNSLVFVGNNKIFSDVILNYTANQYRQVNLKIQLAHGVDVFQAIQLFSSRIQAVPGVRAETPVTGTIVELNSLGTLVNMKFTGLPTDYDALVARGNRVLYEVIKENNYPIPQTRTTWVSANPIPPNAVPPVSTL